MVIGSFLRIESILVLPSRDVGLSDLPLELSQMVNDGFLGMASVVLAVMVVILGLPLRSG